MTRRKLVLIAVGAFLIVVVVLRWPPLEAGVVSFKRVEFNGDVMVVDYRMPGSFEIALGHRVRKRIQTPEALGVRVGGSEVLRSETIATISSTYDPLRGGHVIRLRLSRGKWLKVEGNGQLHEVIPWSPPDATKVTLHPPGDRGIIGEGCGFDVVQIAEAPDHEEYLILYAGRDVRRSVE